MQAPRQCFSMFVPVGILIYSCIKDKVAPTLGEIVSIILAIGGTFLIATHGQLDQLSMTPAGLFWGSLFCSDLRTLYHFTHSLD